CRGRGGRGDGRLDSGFCSGRAVRSGPAGHHAPGLPVRRRCRTYRCDRARGRGRGDPVTQRPLPAPPLPQGRPRLVITGFMGTGKTAAGRDAATRLGLPFFDLDDVVEARAGMTVSQLFDRLGEEEFRARERQVLADAAQVSAAVIATGGEPLYRVTTGPHWPTAR